MKKLLKKFTRTWPWKKLLGIVIMIIFSGNQILADMKLNCYITSLNFNRSYEKGLYDVEEKKTAPSQFSAIIEITSPGKVIGRVIGTSDTGNMVSPYVGTMDDIKIVMNYKYAKNDKGNDFILDLISGRFEINKYITGGKSDKYWIVQEIGKCNLIK